MAEIRGRQLIEKAETWIDPLLERAINCDQIEENVETIRILLSGTVSGTIDENDNVLYQKSVIKRSKNTKIRFKIKGTGVGDVESEERLGIALSMTIDLREIGSIGRKILEIKFTHGIPDSGIPLREMENPELYCSITANDIDAGVEYPRDPTRLLDLRSDEQEMLSDLTSTVLGILPQNPTPLHRSQTI